MAEENNTTPENEDEPSIEEILSSIRDIISDDDEEGEASANADADSADEAAAVQTPDAPAEEEPATEGDDVLDLTDVVDDNDTKDVPEEEPMAEEEKQGQDDIDAMFGSDSGAEAAADDPLAGINLDHPSDDDLDIVETSPEPASEDVSDDLPESDVSEDSQSDDGVDEILSGMQTPVAETAPVEDVEIPDDTILEAAAATATVSSMARLAENIVLSRTADGVTLEDVVRDLLRPMLKDWLDENLPTVIERLVAQELEKLAEKASRK